RHFLGVYRPHSWPISERDQRAITREAANLIGTVCEGLRDRSRKVSAGSKIAGPWARPDPRSERAAVRHVSTYLRDHGFTVQSKERVICGFDLLATSGVRELHVEVKGCRGPDPRFFLSRRERRTAELDPQWRLALVTNALGRPTPPRLLTHGNMMQLFELEPIQWEGRPK